MNVFIILFIIAVTLGVLKFLLGRRCRHQWETAETWQKKDYVVYILRCKNCGVLKKKVIR